MDSQQNNTEQRILEAAEREFMDKGFAGARTTAIAQAAGVTHAMFHYYFRTKEKLFERILSEKVMLIRDIMLDSIGNTDMSLYDKVRETIAKHLDFLAANPELPRFLINEIVYHPERRQYLLSVINTNAPLLVANLQHQIDSLADHGECRRVDARMLILDIISLNILSFVAAPMVNLLLGDLAADRQAFIEMRKKENVDTILRKLRP